MCRDCNGTGIAIVTLDDTKDVGIQRCDTCKALPDDRAAVMMVTNKMGVHRTGHRMPDQRSVTDQLEQARDLCNRTGLYDAADFIQAQLKKKAS